MCDHDDHGDCDDHPDVDHVDQVDDDPDVDDVDVVTDVAGGGAGVEAPRDWQQIQNDQKCIFTFYKNTIRAARRVLSLLGHGHGHCTNGVLADNEKD